MSNRLFIGNRRYSSWSMRGWLAVRLAGLDVEDVVVPLGEAGTPALQDLTPAGLVPALEHDGILIWESLAIGEYCAELDPSLWPASRRNRATARAIAAEMHAGFRALRSHLPMNLGRDQGAETIHPDVKEDVARIERLWQNCLAESPGPFLFGPSPTIADVMFAPVVARFLSYHPPLAPASRSYCHAIRAHPLVDRWYRLAAEEPLSWRLSKYE